MSDNEPGYRPNSRGFDPAMLVRVHQVYCHDTNVETAAREQATTRVEFWSFAAGRRLPTRWCSTTIARADPAGLAMAGRTYRPAPEQPRLSIRPSPRRRRRRSTADQDPSNTTPRYRWKSTGSGNQSTRGGNLHTWNTCALNLYSDAYGPAFSAITVTP